LHGLLAGLASIAQAPAGYAVPHMLADAVTPLSIAAAPAEAEASSDATLDAPEAAAPLPGTTARKPPPESQLDTLAQQPGAAPASNDDVVEVIDASTSSTPAPTPATERFEAHGWARQMLELGFWRHGSRDAEPNAEALPYDRLVARTQLFARARYARGDFFELNLSGGMSYALAEQGPDRSTKSFNGFNGQAVASSYEGFLHELFVGFFWHRFDLRVGQQRIAWGRADFFSPNDVVNPRDNRDPFLTETDLRFVPTLLARGDLNFEFGTLEAVVSPFFVPDRGDILGANWAAMQPDAPGLLRNLANTVPESSVLAVTTPATDLSEPVAGARFSWSTAGWDVSHYYQYGFDGPAIALDEQLAGQLSSANLGQVGVGELPVLIDAANRGQVPFQATFVRRHHVGLDAGTTFGPFAMRLDAAYQSRRVFYREDLLSFVSPATLVVASLEYQTGEREKGILVEGLYVHASHQSPVPLISYDRDTLGVAAVLRWKLREPFSGELRTVAGVHPRTLILQPLLVARFNELSIAAGALWLGGADGSLGHYFRRNRELFLRAKYSF
jgi:hypothetical protein